MKKVKIVQGIGINDFYECLKKDGVFGEERDNACDNLENCGKPAVLVEDLPELLKDFQEWDSKTLEEPIEKGIIKFLIEKRCLKNK